MSRLKKQLKETDLDINDLYTYDEDSIEDRTLSPEEEKKKKMQHIATAVASVLAVGIIAVSVGISQGDKKEKETTSVQVVEQNDETTALVIPTEVVNNSFSSNRYPEITELVSLYYQAKLTGDTASIEKYVDNIEDVNMAEIKASNEYIKKYKNIECFTKPGLEDNSYVVFAKYDIKFKNIETLAPGIDVFYVLRDAETGLVFIHNGATANDDIRTYVEVLQQDEEVVALFNEVNVAFNEALNADPGLNEFYKALTNGTTAPQQ